MRSTIFRVGQLLRLAASRARCAGSHSNESVLIQISDSEDCGTEATNRLIMATSQPQSSYQNCYVIRIRHSPPIAEERTKSQSAQEQYWLDTDLIPMVYLYGMLRSHTKANLRKQIGPIQGPAEFVKIEWRVFESQSLWLFLLFSIVLTIAVWPRLACADETLDFASLEDAVGEVFRTKNVAGGLVVYDENADRFYRINEDRVRMRAFPASTFKILNSLIFLEESIVESEHTTVKWDGQERELPIWNQDQTLASAFRRSAVWVYQELARTTGLERIQTYVDAVGYGNGQLGTTADMFWLEGPLMISPEEQIHFLRRLRSGDLPFRPDVMDTVKAMMIDEENAHYVLRGKTGWAIRTDPNVGWYVGYLETNSNTFFFALTVDILPDGRGRDRKRIVKDIFLRLGLTSG